MARMMVIMSWIDLDVWKLIVSKELRQRVLDVCSDGVDSLKKYLLDLQDTPQFR
jgi:hypothetical protein